MKERCEKVWFISYFQARKPSALAERMNRHTSRQQRSAFLFDLIESVYFAERSSYGSEP